MASDPTDGRVLLFGGQGDASLGDTWSWNGRDWTQRTPAFSPSPRCCMGIADDPAGQRVALFGGLGRGLFDDTWTWDGTDWARRRGQSPTPRYGVGMTFATTHDRIVLFGGWDGSRAIFGDTWTWDGSGWTQRPAGSIRLDVRSGPPGTPVQVEAWGFAAGELVKVTFWDATRGRTLLRKVRADATGAFTIQITIPPDATVGRQRVKAKALARADVVKRGFTVIG